MNAHDLPVVVFLDFDGVLHHFFPMPDSTDEDNQHFAFAPHFEHAVRACPRKVEIVISSTWRTLQPLDEIKQKFSPDIADKIVGVTPFMDLGNQRGSRQTEVEAWLQEHRPHSQWVGVDDMPDLYETTAAVVACADHFLEREHGMLVQAVSDPLGYAQQYPHGRTKFKM